MNISSGAVHETGTWSDLKIPPFAKDDPVVLLVSELEEELRPLLVAKVKYDPDMLTAPINVNMYRTQVDTGMNYTVKIEVAFNFFIAYIYSSINGSPHVEEVQGPLPLHSPKRATKPEFF